MTAKRIASAVALVLGITTLISCSSGPSEPAIGSPGFYWQGARLDYRTGDYMKTLQNLDNLLATDNEYTARALPWSLVLKSGIAEGYMQAADNYELGAHMNRTDPSVFRRQVSDNRAAASQLALQFAEDFDKLDKVKGDTITLEFAYPKGTAAPVAEFTKVAGGIALTPTETETAQQESIERGVLLAACRAAGAPDDTAKTEDLLKTGVVTVPRATFMTAVADSMFRFSQLYAADKLDEPQKRDALIERAQAALAGVPESKETKELKGEIQAAIKKAKAGK
jgi:hypothetical protein